MTTRAKTAADTSSGRTSDKSRSAKPSKQSAPIRQGQRAVKTRSASGSTKKKTSSNRTSVRQPSSASADRFEQRRNDAARQSSRRRLQIVAGLSVVSCLAVATVALINSSLLDVDEVIVVGAEKANPEVVINAAGIEPGQSLLEIDPAESAELVERVPWVGTAEVRRSFNGQVEIAIAERQPLVALPASAGFALVDHWGRQLEVVGQRPARYLPVAGIEASGQAGDMAPPETALLLTFVSSASPFVIEQVDLLRVTDGEVKAHLKSGGEVNFGDSEQMGEKIQAAETLLKRVDLACLAEIDVRVPSAPALKRYPTNGETEEASGTGQTTTEGGPQEDPKQPLPDC